MVDAIVAQWHGNNYQSRIFWLFAFNLLRNSTNVTQVTFEADGPKSFDDIVVYYDPPVARSCPQPIAAEYYQVKWHVLTGGRIGFKDLIRPEYINAKSKSLLERLKDAKAKSDVPARFCLITPDSLVEGDQLGELVSGNDKSILTEKLFDGTKTDRSRMGQVRSCWREHLNLSSDDELREIIEGLTIMHNYKSLQELREEVNWKAETVGLVSYSASDSDFRYDELARQLKARDINELNQNDLIDICKSQGLWTGEKQVNTRMTIAIRSFQGLSADVIPAEEENTLRLTGSFRARYIHDDKDWQRHIRPQVNAFLVNMASRSQHIRLILDAHASIAYLSGAVYHVKTGLDLELIQKGRVGAKVWLANDGIVGPDFIVSTRNVSHGQDIAIAASISQPVDGHVNKYVVENLPQVGKIISVTPPNGPGQQSILGGEHAASLAEHLSNTARDQKVNIPDATVHIFAACPNSFLFYLGQNHSALAPVIVYEFDYDRQGNKTYQPSFIIDTVDS